MNRIGRALAIAILVLFASPVLATDKVQITADRFVVEEGANLATFSGKVVVVQGSTTINADTVQVKYGTGGASDIENLVASGNLVIVTPEQRVTGERGTYDPETRVMLVSGNVVATSSSGRVTGPQLRVDFGAKHNRIRATARRARHRGVRAMSEAAGFDHTDWLVAHSLAKRFGKREVVRDVSIAVRRGEAVGLLGPNGAGKTTVFTMIMGLVRPDAGEVLLDGRKITALPLFQRGKLGIGYLPQEPSIFRGMSVKSNILAVLEGHVRSRKARLDRLNALLEEFSISHLGNANALALSGGERRRVEIARALAADPVFMLLDEPFAGIDPIAVADIKGLVRQLTERGIGVLITDHNVRETLRLVDRAYLIFEGKVMVQGRPDTIAADAEARRIYLGDDFEL